MPWLSAFPETNVRTYVMDGSGRRGVWFFSLDAARYLAVAAARLGFGLPYFWARMKVFGGIEIARYSSVRRGEPAAMSEIAVAIGAPIASPAPLEVFLTARFRLYAQRRGHLVMAEIWHKPWSLGNASLIALRQSLIQAAGLAVLDSPPLVHFARRVDVMVGRPRQTLPEIAR